VVVVVVCTFLRGSVADDNYRFLKDSTRKY
jgi:hypothetical protein